MNRKVLAVLVVAAALVFGFFQERVKVELNFVAEHAVKISGYDQMSFEQRASSLQNFRKYHPFDYYYSHDELPVLLHFSMRELSIVKWGLALFFLIVNGAMVILCFNWWVGNTNLTKTIIAMYFLFLILAVLVYLATKMVGLEHKGYGFARKILGALQSPVPLMILIPAYTLYFKSSMK